jgi:hypothetical protein
MSILNTRDKEFTKAKQLYEEYKDSAQFVAQSLGLLDDDNEHIIEAEIEYDRWEEGQLNKVYKAFQDEHSQYLRQGQYFFGCSLNVYQKHLESRQKDYYKASDNSSEVGFILNEFMIGKLDFDFGICDNDTLNTIDVNLKLRYNLLQERLIALGHNVDGILDVEKTAQEFVSPREVIIDLSDTNGKEKVIYLNELGIIDYLRNNFHRSNLSYNRLAALLSGITGVKQDTMQSYINPIINKKDKISQRNNPYENEKNVAKIRSILINQFNLDLPNNN